jgi:hypothetical protein
VAQYSCFLAIAASVILQIALLPKPHLRFFLYFAVLFGAIAATGIIGTKRLLFISGWLLLPLALAVAAPNRKSLRKALVASLVFIAAMGWLGFVVKKYYASEHLIEPWPEIADEAAMVIKDGGQVLTNSPSLLFSMNYSLQRLRLTDSTLPGYANHPSALGIDRWDEGIPFDASLVLFVKGVNINFAAETTQAQEWFKSHCMPISTRELVPDSGYSLKSRLFPGYGQMPFRILMLRYNCRARPR